MKYHQSIKVVCDECSCTADAVMEFEMRCKKNSNREIAQPMHLVEAPEGWVRFRRPWHNTQVLCKECVEMQTATECTKIPLLEVQFDH